MIKFLFVVNIYFMDSLMALRACDFPINQSQPFVTPLSCLAIENLNR